MPDDIRVNNEQGIIEVISSGVLSERDMTETKAMLEQILGEQGLKKVLIDTTGVETVPSAFSIFDVIRTALSDFWVALVVDQSSAIANDVAFGETVAVNRGLRFKLFGEREEALQWLNRQ